MSPARARTTRAWPKSIPGILAAVVGVITGYVVVAVVGTALTSDAVVGSMIANLAMLAALLWRTKALPPQDHLSPVATAPVPPHLLALVVVGLGLVWFLGQSAAQWIYTVAGSQNFQTHQVTLGEHPLWLLLVAQLVFAPLGEEAMMRGVIYPVYRRRFGVLNAAVTTSVIFAVLHGNLVQLALTVPLGIFLALLYELTHTISVTVAAHMLFNVASIVTPAAVIQHVANGYVVAGAGVATVLVLAGLYQARAGGTESGSETA